MSDVTVDPETGEVTEPIDPEDAAILAQLSGDEELPSEDETPPEPEPEPVDDPGPSEEAVIKLGRKFDTYGKAVAETYGETFAALLECPLCPTNHKGFVDLRYAGKVPGEVEAEVHAYLTASNVGTYAQDPGTHKCQVCEGKTIVKTGAIAGQYVTRTCPNCGGYGFMPPPGELVGSKGVTGQGNVIALPVEDTGPSEDVDEWGEPRVLPDGTLNANFGMMPNRKQVHPVYGVTANLTAQSA